MCALYAVYTATWIKRLINNCNSMNMKNTNFKVGKLSMFDIVLLLYLLLLFLFVVC